MLDSPFARPLGWVWVARMSSFASSPWACFPLDLPWGLGRRAAFEGLRPLGLPRGRLRWAHWARWSGDIFDDAKGDGAMDQPYDDDARGASANPAAAEGASGFVPATARLHMAPSTARLGSSVKGVIGHEHERTAHREGESTLDRLMDDLTENAGASDDLSVRGVFRAISDDVAANKQDIGWHAAREAATDALGRLKATLPGHHEKAHRTAKRRDDAP